MLLFREGRTLLADETEYDRNTGMIKAQGDVWLRSSSHDYLWTKEVNLKQDLSEGTIAPLHLLLADHSRFAAREGTYRDQRRTELTHVIYTPCKDCKFFGDSPLWQLRAEEVVHDREEKVVQYHNARLEFVGVPIFYTPYFRHPDPSVKRKTGLLVPTIGNTNDLGFIFGVPIYGVINDNQDITLTPLLTTRQGPVLIGEYRHRYRDAEWLFQGSHTRSQHLPRKGAAPNDPHRDRWHGVMRGRVDFTEHHVLNVDINRASDLTYLRRYPIQGQNSYKMPKNKNLTSTASLEQFYPHSYASMRFYSFQTDVHATTPLVFPLVNYDYETAPGRLGETFRTNANFQALDRNASIPGKFPKNSQRAILRIGGQVPYISPWGDEWQLQGWMRSDIYRLHRYQRSVFSRELKNEKHGRIFPQASLRWRYPFIYRAMNMRWLLEPEAMFISSTITGKNTALPNEDSDNVELDYTNLFKLCRFPGYDRVDEGTRLVYGLNSRMYFGKGSRLLIFAGQSKRIDRRAILPAAAGEDRKGSDAILRMKFDPSSWVGFQHHSRLDRKTMRAKVAESYVTLGYNILKLQTGHIYVAPQPSLNNQRINQVNWQLSTEPYADWSVAFAESRNLHRNTGGALARMLSVRYHNECFHASVGAYQTRYNDRDIRPDKGILFQLTFKNLGTFKPITAPNSPNDVLDGFFS